VTISTSNDTVEVWPASVLKSTAAQLLLLQTWPVVINLAVENSPYSQKFTIDDELVSLSLFMAICLATVETQGSSQDHTSVDALI